MVPIQFQKLSAIPPPDSSIHMHAWPKVHVFPMPRKGKAAVKEFVTHLKEKITLMPDPSLSPEIICLGKFRRPPYTH